MIEKEFEELQTRFDEALKRVRKTTSWEEKRLLLAELRSLARDVEMLVEASLGKLESDVKKLL